MSGDQWDESTSIKAERPDEPNYDIELSAPPQRQDTVEGKGL